MTFLLKMALAPAPALMMPLELTALVLVLVMVLVVHPTIRNPSTQMEQNHLINDGQNPATSDDGL